MDILDKINSKLYSHDEIRDMEIVLEMAMIVDEDAVMNEAFDMGMFKTGAKALMKSAGIGAHKSGDGLIQVALKSGKVMAEFIWHALKAAGGNEESKERVKELSQTKISKEQVLDFLLKLDMATLHLVSGPLHIIDAITGWHVWASIKTQSQDMLTKAKTAIRNLVDASKGVNNKDILYKLKDLMFGIAKLFGLEQETKLISAV